VRFPPAVGLSRVNADGNISSLATLIFGTYVWAFEITGALLITAALGAMVLAFTDRHGKGGKRTQKELVVARFRGEYERPSPLPGPGVFATANSVATPALLPDGSVAPESLSALIESTSAARFEGKRKQVADAAPKPDAHALVAGTASEEQAGEDESK
jgi:NADH-quinone oxidoreductase subunit J